MCRSSSKGQLAEVIAATLLVKRKNFYDDIISSNPSQAKFKNGWYNRLKALAAEAGVQSPV
ncbi:MAG: hypothetical protein LBQ19_01075 [Synergistaceae bacterium]|nr:hypothetical protein [Synergistaceae bacterium]